MIHFSKFAPKTRRAWLFLGLSLVVVGEGIFLLAPRQVPSLTFAQHAANIVAQCEESKYRPTCYDEEVPKLMDHGLSMEDAFEVTRLVQDLDKSFAYCHVLGHELSAREVAKDPAKWKEVVTRCPSGVCSNGCIHGGFQERFRAESFTDAELEKHKSELYDLCEPRGTWRPTGLEQGSCYHALGHLTMYLTNADIRKSLTLCTEITGRSKRSGFEHLCFDGAFMQIYQPLEPEDFALIKGKEVGRDQVKQFCDGFTGIARSSCWTEAWPLFRADLAEAKNLPKFCSYLSDKEEDRCYASTIYVITAQLNLDPARVQEYCADLPGDRQGICYSNAASRLIETDYRNAANAAGICAAAEKKNAAAGERCFGELLMYSTYNFHVGSPSFYALCNELPQPWKDRCLAKRTSSGS